MTETLPQSPISLLTTERWPTYSDGEIDEVAQILRSGRVNQWTGDRVVAFQDAYEQRVGNGCRAIALANGSVALELALRAFGVGPGDEVIVTPRTFVASAFCVMLVGATPVFADVDPRSGNITPETIEAVCTDRTRGIIPVHLAGWPADMEGICELATQRGLFVIEDCAQAHGALIDGKPVGSFGDAAAFSFCQDKIITTGGEGGLTLFKDSQAFDWAWSYKDHGKNRAKMVAPSAASTGFRWLHDNVGTNWRMLETSAAIGLSQLDNISQTQAARAERAAIWADALSGIDGIRVPEAPSGFTHAHYKFYAYIDRAPSENRALRDGILARVNAEGIRGFSGSCSEVYLEEAFRELHVDPLPVARELGDSSLMFEVHPTLDTSRLRARAAVVAQIVRDELSNG